METGHTLLKLCTGCGESKPVEQFRINRKMRDGIDSWCKACGAQAKRKLRQARVRKSIIAVASKRCQPCDTVKPAAEFNLERGNPDGLSRICRSCRSAKHYRHKAKSPERIRAISRASNAKRLSTVAGKLNHRISAQMQYILGEKKGGHAWKALLGYSADDLRQHLERQFSRGMGWSNMGDWHIDHIVPLSAFTFSGPHDPEVRRAWALTNLRPLWAEDNLRKRSKRTHLL